MNLLDHAVNLIDESSNEFQCLGCSGSSSDCSASTTLLASFKSFVCCPIFVKRGNENSLDVFLYGAIIESIERLLKALAKAYHEFSESLRHPHSDCMLSDLTAADATLQISGPLDSDSRIVDMELDVIEDTKDADILPVGGKIGTGISFSAVKWKLGMVSLISSFHSVLDSVTWDILFELMEKECDMKVSCKVVCML